MRFMTAGESHGPKLSAIVEGFPANLPINKERMTSELIKRQGGYGRGRRMQIEKDTFQFGSGIRHGKTLGSPIMIEITNDDFKHWSKIMGSEPLTPEEEESMKRVITKPRPGHADLVGGMKYNMRDLRNILERSSARETASRVAGWCIVQGTAACPRYTHVQPCQSDRHRQGRGRLQYRGACHTSG